MEDYKNMFSYGKLDMRHLTSSQKERLGLDDKTIRIMKSYEAMSGYTMDNGLAGGPVPVQIEDDDEFDGMENNWWDNIVTSWENR